MYSWILGGLSRRHLARGRCWPRRRSPQRRRSCSPTAAILDVLSVGDEEAASLGVDVGRARLLIVVAATVGTAAAVAVSGLIGFVGIIVPHTIRLLVSSSYRAIVPLSLLVGAGFLVLADVVARTVLSPAELPIGVVTAFFGAPFFAVVLRRSRRMRLVKPAVETREVSVTLGARRRSCPASRSRSSRGEWVALIGPNGAGKTTLLRALAGLVAVHRDDPARRGSALAGPAGAELGAARSRSSRSCRETPPALTVAEYVLLGRTPHIGYLGREGARRPPRRGARDRRASACGRSRSGRWARSAAASASGSCSPARSRRRPPMLLLDEPTERARPRAPAGRARAARRAAPRDGLTVIVCAMHDLSLAGQYADRLVLLDRGRVRRRGSADEVLTRGERYRLLTKPMSRSSTVVGTCSSRECAPIESERSRRG